MTDTASARGFTPTRRRLTGLRVRALGIAGDGRSDDPASVVGDLLALQAQDFPGALWSVGLRTPSSTRADVEARHESGEVVRSWTMRGTLHLVLAEDLPWMLSLTGQRMVRASEGRRRRLELDQAQFARADALVRDRLAGGASCSRAELYATFEAGGLPTTGQRGIHLLAQLAQTGVIVLVGQTEWALLEDRVPHPRIPERLEALGEFARRYFVAHGPATIRDFAWWSSLTLTDARAALAAARETLDETTIDGESYYLRPGLEPAPPGVQLLPGFDEYLLGYTDRRAPLAGADLSVVAPGANGMFLSTIVIDGEVAGTWRRTQRAGRVEVSLAPFRPLDAAELEGIDRALARYGEFLELPVELEQGRP